MFFWPGILWFVTEGWRKWDFVSAGIQWFLGKIKHCEKSYSPHPSIPPSFIGQVGQVPLILWQENLSSWMHGDQTLSRQSVPKNWGLHININPPTKHKVLNRFPGTHQVTGLYCVPQEVQRTASEFIFSEQYSLTLIHFIRVLESLPFFECWWGVSVTLVPEGRGKRTENLKPVLHCEFKPSLGNVERAHIIKYYPIFFWKYLLSHSVDTTRC